MRTPTLCLLMVLAGPAAAAPTNLTGLETAWHACLRESYAHQPPHQSRAGSERNALDECRGHEDAYVAAIMAARAEGDRPFSAQARAWAASVAAYVWDPVTAWIAALRR
ncbi:hypothetical protein Q8W71_01850 [Methylobacterium sp. NEAU 140]|uniref:hypothetical protein n=1 Tax=Methylobacterium sp. NEAU 140 TaxID=3064945 RepID=UPI00273455F1|nr:hypothetical protein [Methylobacterium sp. NEAU 140]MDP4021353.1 hypothetical protein [Methylobacterium sp. NEAU 140]